MLTGRLHEASGKTEVGRCGPFVDQAVPIIWAAWRVCFRRRTGVLVALGGEGFKGHAFVIFKVNEVWTNVFIITQKKLSVGVLF